VSPNRAAWRGRPSIHSPGCDDTEALLPVHPNAPPAGRLWRELAGIPERHLFIELTDLQARWPVTGASEAGDTVEVVILLAAIPPGLAARVDRSALVPFCVTAVNAFERRLERVVLDARHPEAALIVDRLRPRDHVVLSVLSVHRPPDGPGTLRRLRPLHGPAGCDGDAGAGAWTSRRVRMPALGVAGSHSECRLAVTSGAADRVAAAGEADRSDPLDAFTQANSHLTVMARVGEGDRPLHVAAAGARWWLDAVGVGDVRITCGPSRPHAPDPAGPSAWSLVDALRWNHLSLVDEADPSRAANALQQLIVGHGPADDPVWTRVAGAVRAVRALPVVRRLPGPGPMAHARGVAVRVDLDMEALQGPGLIAFGAVLDRALAAQATANAFVELTLADADGRVRHRFAPRAGDLPLV
jgi:type VI secretion system protein ImpG